MINFFDMHCDTASGIFEKKQSLLKNSLHIDLDRTKNFNKCGQVYALWHEDARNLEAYRAVLNYFLVEIEKNRDKISLCTSYQEILNATENGKQAALLSCEGAELLGCSERELEIASEQGVSIVNLCWNFDNELCGSAMDTESGLTEKGKNFVKKATELGVILDMSHVSDRAISQVLEAQNAKIVASHSNSRAVCNHKRNLPDELLRDIAQIGGVVGINLFPTFLGSEDLSKLPYHIEKMLRFCGEKKVCFGSDFDGIHILPKGMTGIESMEFVYKTLLNDGFTEQILDDIFYNNLMRFWERAL